MDEYEDSARTASLQLIVNSSMEASCPDMRRRMADVDDLRMTCEFAAAKMSG
jgi:hypothetical protein